MRVKLFTFRYSATLGGFDDGVLQDFVRDKEVVAFREHFYAVNEVPHVTCVLTYQDAVVPAAVLQLAHEIPPRERPPGRPDRYQRKWSGERRDVTADLSEPERVLFNTLREWRAKKAHDEGVSAFLVFTNRQLLEIVRKRPESPNALGQLEGIGPGKVKRYGAEVLALLKPQGSTVLPANGQPMAQVQEVQA
jgi:superfamily II DNA helicase RecQ